MIRVEWWFPRSMENSLRKNIWKQKKKQFGWMEEYNNNFFEEITHPEIGELSLAEKVWWERFILGGLLGGLSAE